jgi:hypothetical protein
MVFMIKHYFNCSDVCKIRKQLQNQFTLFVLMFIMHYDVTNKTSVLLLALGHFMKKKLYTCIFREFYKSYFTHCMNIYDAVCT